MCATCALVDQRQFALILPDRRRLALDHVEDLASPEAIAFFRDHDLGYRIRRLRHLARRLSEDWDDVDREHPHAREDAREAVYRALGHYFDREGTAFLGHDFGALARGVLDDPAAVLDAMAERRALVGGRYPYGIAPTVATAAAMDASVTRCYGAWKAANLKKSPTFTATAGVYAGQSIADGWHVRFSSTYACVSEGMGYGMLITVLMAGVDPDAQALFNGLLRTARGRFHGQEIRPFQHHPHTRAHPPCRPESAFTRLATFTVGSTFSINYLGVLRPITRRAAEPMSG